MDTKQCNTCKEHKPKTEEFFYVDRRKNIFRYECRDCQHIRQSQKYHRDKKRNPERIAKRQASVYKSHATAIKTLKKQILDYYGARCTCCGEEHKEFLVIDHVLNDGAHERKVLKLISERFYKHIIQEGFPDKYQILCMNCNWAKSRCPDGCPHVAEKNIESVFSCQVF